ncbi:MAG: hypothetical protein LBI33_12780 [Propionibacteriaceae bacterium]|jgi:hypothetical protein|nr:hypothetical protein [Propionibacteriaceae bacterium]
MDDMIPVTLDLVHALDKARAALLWGSAAATLTDLWNLDNLINRLRAGDTITITKG